MANGKRVFLCLLWMATLPLNLGWVPTSRQWTHHALTRVWATPSELNGASVGPQDSALTENEDGSYGWTDQEFKTWVLQEMIAEAPDLYTNYTNIFEDVADCILKWRQRYRGDNALWKRLFKRDRVVKEVIESIPIIDAVNTWIRDQSLREDLPNVTIIDLCSGKGYLSMILSEYLPADRVSKCVLVDKAWPMCHSEPKAHHINWAHIYGDLVETDYFGTWPIPLHTSKQDLKQSSTIRQFEKRFSEGPVLMLGVHLCGTLSIQAIKLFHHLPNAKLMILKPCCLPGMLYAKRQEHFEVGRYRFPTKEVCAPGQFRGKAWQGPPRWQLEGKFLKWCKYLLESLHENGESMNTCMLEVQVQNKGGYQNNFLLAEKSPVSRDLWQSKLDAQEVSTTSVTQ